MINFKFRLVVILMSVMLLFACSKKEVQVGSKTFDVSKNYVIAISQSAEKESLDSMRQGFVIGMKNLGYLEEVNVTYLYENAKNNSSYAEQIAKAYKDKEVDLFLTIGEKSTVAMCNAEKEKPIVFAGVGNADRLNLNASNDNVTGVIDSHLIEERLNFINVNYPDVKKLGIIYTADDKLAIYDVDYFKFVATAYDIDIYTVSITKKEDITKALDNILPKVDGIALVTDYMIDDVVSDIVTRANAEKKEVFGDTNEHMKKGAVVATTRDYQLVGEKSATIVDQILKGNKKANEIKIDTVSFKIS